jgi:hypothetical protein
MGIEFTIFWYVYLLVICWLMEKLTNCFSKLNIFTPFIYSFILKHGISVPFNRDINMEYGGIYLSDDVIFRWVGSLMMMYASFIIGLLFAKKFFGNRTIIPRIYQSELDIAAKSGSTGLKQIFPIIALAIIAFTFAMLWNPTLLIRALSGDLTSELYKSSRVEYGQGSASAQGVLYRIANTFKYGVLPLLISILFVIQRYDKKWRIFFWPAFFAVMILNFISGQKSGMVETVLCILLATIFMNGNLSISLRSKTGFSLMSIFVIVTFVVSPWQYQLQYPTLTYLEGVESTFSRFGIETSRTLQLYFHVYPDIFPHLLGFSSSIVSGIFGDGINLDPARVVRSFIAFGHTDDATGSWNAAFIGSAWADFSYFGVALQSILVVMLLWYYHQWYVKSPKTAGVIGTYTALSLASMTVSEGNLLTGLLTGGFGTCYFIYYAFKLSDKKIVSIRSIRGGQNSDLRKI